MTGAAAPTRAEFRILPDQPLAPADELQFDARSRLEPIKTQLSAVLARWLNAPKSERPSSPLRIGLFGGLGQGKSSVVQLVLAELQNKTTRWQRWLELLRGPRIRRFDVSHFKADDLEWRFLTAVVWRRTFVNLMCMAVLTLLLLVLVAAVGLIFGVWSWSGFWSAPDAALRLCWLVGTGAVAWLSIARPSLWKALSGIAKQGKAILGAANLGRGLHYTARDLWAHRLAVLSGTLPALVIVDDLDRAKVDQQRSFLRALRRYSGLMGFAVVVCMDESEILAAPADPESPDELLRKTIEVELRMPDRSVEDIAHLAMVGMRELARVNAADVQINSVLRQPVQVADLARVLLWWPGVVSPRLVKRLLNDTGLAADQRQAWRADLWSGLLRLQLLWAVAPGLRHHGATLQRSLERNDAAVFADALTAVKNLDVDRRAHAVACFAATRAMQPAQGHGWQELLGGHTVVAAAHMAQTGASTAGAAEIPTPDWSGHSKFDMVRLYCRLANVLRARAQGYDKDEAWWRLDLNPAAPAKPELPGLRYHRSTVAQRLHDGLDVEQTPQSWRANLAAYDAHCWLVWVAVLQHKSVTDRLAIYDALRPWATEVRGRSPSAGAWLQREVLADAQAWLALPLAQRRQWARRDDDAESINPNRWLIALAAGDSPLALTLPGTDDLESLVRIRWLEAWVPDVAELDHTMPAEVLDAAFWPPVQPAAWLGPLWLAQLHPHVQMFVRSRPATATTIPPTLRSAWRRAWLHLNLPARLKLIHAVAADIANGPPVRLSRLDAWRVCMAAEDSGDLPPYAEWFQGPPLPAEWCLAGWWWLALGGTPVQLKAWNDLGPGSEAAWQLGIDTLIGDPMLDQLMSSPAAATNVLDQSTCALLFRSALIAAPDNPASTGLAAAKERRIVKLLSQRADRLELLAALGLHDDPDTDLEPPTP